jgi:hypothetical protein
LNGVRQKKTFNGLPAQKWVEESNSDVIFIMLPTSGQNRLYAIADLIKTLITSKRFQTARKDASTTNGKSWSLVTVSNYSVNFYPQRQLAIETIFGLFLERVNS